MGSSGGGTIWRSSTPSQMMTPTTATSAATTALAAPPAHSARTFTVRFGPEGGGAGMPMTALQWSQDPGRETAEPRVLATDRPHPLGGVRLAPRVADPARRTDPRAGGRRASTRPPPAEAPA